MGPGILPAQSVPPLAYEVLRDLLNKGWKLGSWVGSSFYKPTSEAAGVPEKHTANNICTNHFKLFIYLISGLPGNPGRPGAKGEFCFFPDAHFLSKDFILARISCSTDQSLDQQWHLVALGREDLKSTVAKASLSIHGEQWGIWHDSSPLSKPLKPLSALSMSKMPGDCSGSCVPALDKSRLLPKLVDVVLGKLFRGHFWISTALFLPPWPLSAVTSQTRDQGQKDQKLHA